MVDKLNGLNKTNNYPTQDRVDSNKAEKTKNSEYLFTKAKKLYGLAGERFAVDDSKVYSGNEVDSYLDEKTGLIKYEKTPEGTISTPKGSHPSDLPQELIDKENAKHEKLFPTGKIVQIDGIPLFDEAGMAEYIILDPLAGLVDNSSQIDDEQ